MSRKLRQPGISYLLLNIGIAIITIVGGPGQAADLKILRVGDSYQIKISGSIKAGDHDKLRAAITEKTDFPDGLLIEGGAGDIDESMVLGHFLRENMLATTAGKQCSNTCFLIWAAGIHRRARGPVEAQVNTDDEDTLRKYLTTMEITEDVIASALSSESAVLTETMISANEYSPRHGLWLTERCGEFTEQQALDRQAIQALQSMEASLNAMGMGGGSMSTVSAETQREAARAREFSPQYRDELNKKYAEVSSCRKKAIAVARADPGST